MSPTSNPDPPALIARRHFIRGALVMCAALAADHLPFAGVAFGRGRHRWSNPRTWGGRVPGRYDVVRITQPVLLDRDARVAGIVIEPGGSLIFHPRRSVTLKSRGNVIVRGKLTMAPASPAKTHRLIFVDVNERRFQGSGLDPKASDVGLWVMGGGVLSGAGASKRAWTRVHGSVQEGASSIKLMEDPTGWRVGDEIVITPTLNPKDRDHAEAFDTARIKSISGRTVALSRRTSFAHPAVSVAPRRTLSAEVLNLTRNVRIEGTRSGRAHIFIRSRRPQSIANCAVRHLGPRRRNRRDRRYSKVVLGRWPVHFHHCMNGSRGSVVSGLVARDVGSHAYVAHMSHGVKFRNCIAYHVLEDPFWWDKFETTHDALYDRCVAARVNTRSKDKDGSLYGFVMGLGKRNVVRNCVATGVLGNAHSDTAGFAWLEKNGGLWTFTNNVSHNNRNNGLFNWLNPGDVHKVKRFTAYNNGKAGVEQGAYENRYRFEDVATTGSPYSLILHSVSKDAPRLTFTGCRLDGNILIPKRLGGQAGAPVLIIASELDGKVIVDHRGSPPHPENFGLYDFVRIDVRGRDLEPGDFNIINMMPGSLIRVQRKNDTAYKINELGLAVPIPAFY